MSRRNEKLEEYEFTTPIATQLFNQIARHLAKTLPAEIEYTEKIRYVVGNRFAQKDDPLRRKRVVEGIGGNITFPAKTQLRSLEFGLQRDKMGESGLFRRFCFVGLISPHDEHYEEYARSMREVKNALNSYFVQLID